MVSLIGKPLDKFDRITELSNSIGSALENYIAARTAIRDYVISLDEKYYAEVEQRIHLATKALDEAEPLADENEIQVRIRQTRDSILAWSQIARQVRDAFAAYYDAVENKVIAYFDALVHRGSVLLQANAALASTVILDVQTANAAIAGYLLRSEERLAENAYRAISWAKEKIDQVEQSDKQASPALQSFTASLDACAEGLSEAVASRKNAYRLFHENLAPMGVVTQRDLEQFRQQVIEYQRKFGNPGATDS